MRHLHRILPNAATAVSLKLCVLTGCTPGTQAPEPWDDRTRIAMIRAQDERRAAGLVRGWRQEGYRGERDDTWTADDRRAIGAAREVWESTRPRPVAADAGADAGAPLFRIERAGARQLVTIVWLNLEESGGVRVVPGFGITLVEVFGDGRPPQLLPSL